MSENAVNSAALTPAGAIDGNVIDSGNLTPAGAIDNNVSSNIKSDVSEEAAAVRTLTAEDTASLDSYKRLVESQTATIDELTDKVVSLQTQIAKLVNGGAVVSDGKAEDMPPVPSMGQAEEYIPLADLGKMISKE